MQNSGNAAKVAKYGMLIALAFIFSYIEAVMPITMGVPGIKLGLANLVTIVGLSILGIKGTIAVSLIRILLMGMTFGNMSSMIYSLSGGTLSLLLMILCKEKNWFSQIGISIVGGVAHNIGQLCFFALFIVEQGAIFYYLPFLLVSGTVAGALIGVLGGIITKRIKTYTKNL